MRFTFGGNWQSYAAVALNESRVAEAREAFRGLFRGIELAGRRFLDVGYGQGLGLYLAQEAGAKVFGIDPDPGCQKALDLTARFFPGLPPPPVSSDSILEDAFVKKYIGAPFDIVHSWGVLPLAGDMWKALENAAALVGPGGFLVVSIYNSHWSSGMWWWVKRLFNRVPGFAQTLMVMGMYPVIYTAKWCVTRQNPRKKQRGMDFFHDVADWLGGFPYQYATREEVERRAGEHGLVTLRTVPAQVPTGCNEFVFRKEA